MIFKCPKCQQPIECDDQYQGQTTTCPHCSVAIQIPYVSQAPVVVPVAAATSDSQQKAPESVIMSGRPSVRAYIFHLLGGLICFALGFVLPLFFILTIIFWGAAIIRKCSQKWELTTKRLTATDGIFVKNESSVRVSDIRGIDIKRTVGDVFCGTASVWVGTSASAGTEIKIHHISGAKKLQKKLNELRDQAE